MLPGVDRRFRVPDEIDPGYTGFRIWIEEPTGERRLYRSPRRYCSTRRTRSISPTRPFERDVSIFGEAGGYTFRMAGRHRLWAEFGLGTRGQLRSAAVEVCLLPRAALTEDMVRIGELLTTRLGKTIIYHRLFSAGADALRPYRELAEYGPRLPATSELRYALGRAYATISRRRDREEPATRERAREWLGLASDDPSLDEHRRRRAQEQLRRLAKPG